MCLKGGSVRIGVTTHFHIFGPNLRSIDWGGGGGKSKHFWKGLFTGSPKISKSEPYELQEKAIVVEA